MYRYFDIHSHLTFQDFDTDRSLIIEKMKEIGMGTITVGTELGTSQAAVELAHEHAHLFATVGIHPTHGEAFDEETFSKLAEDRKVVAIGECGLDYFRIDPNDTETKEAQKKMFEAHIVLALKHDMPLMIHGRPRKGSMDAYEDIIEILESTKHQAPNSKLRGNIHFFVGDIPTAQKFLDLGFTMSFDGPITFSRDYDDVIKFIPENMIMAETDAPFATPEPFRGHRNEPLYVEHVVRTLAEVRGADFESFRKTLVENALRVFGIPQN
ncbi:MAG: TatD family hydrolase [Patescibacteria group bacterium]